MMRMLLAPHHDSHYGGDDDVLTYGETQGDRFRFCGASNILNGDKNPRLCYSNRLSCDNYRFRIHNNHLHMNRNSYLSLENDSNDDASCCDDGNYYSDVYAYGNYSPILCCILPYSIVPDYL